MGLSLFDGTTALIAKQNIIPGALNKKWQGITASMTTALMTTALTTPRSGNLADKADTPGADKARLPEMLLNRPPDAINPV